MFYFWIKWFSPLRAALVTLSLLAFGLVFGFEMLGLVLLVLVTALYVYIKCQFFQ